jgi:hypothetical protein
MDGRVRLLLCLGCGVLLLSVGDGVIADSLPIPGIGFLILGVIGILAALFLELKSLRFSLRALLGAITVAALFLGTVAALVRYFD